MSIKCMNRVWLHSKQKGSALLLLLAIADYADDNGFAWPGLDTLAGKIRMSPRHTTRLATQLAEGDELIAFNRRGKGNLYIVTTASTPEQVQAACRKAGKFGIESDMLAVITDNLAVEKVTSCQEKVTPASLESDIAMSSDPSLTVNDPSTTVGPGEEDDAAWLAESRVIDTGDDVSLPATIPVDPLDHALQVAERVQPNWADPVSAGGYDEFAAAPVDAFCEIRGVRGDDLPPEERKDWGKVFGELAQKWHVDARFLANCIRAIPDSDYNWKSYSSPWQRGFQEDMGVMIGRALAEKKRGPPIVEVKR